MIKLLIELVQFLNSTAPLLTSLAIFTLLSVLLSKSIKKHAAVYYIVFAIPFALVAIPFIARLLGIEMLSFSRIPFLGGIIRDYIHFGTFAFPLLIIIMYIGALDMKIPAVKKLMNIRKELSIISGFPVFAHSLIRVTNNFPNSLKFFTNHAEYMETGRVVNVLGAGISNFSFVLGIVLLALFIPLWVTSFDSVHKRMGSIKWKKLQKWSYVFYALLFIHAMGIQVGGLLNPRGGGNSQRTAIENVQSVAIENKNVAENISNSTNTENAGLQANSERRERRNNKDAEKAERDNENLTETIDSTGRERSQSGREVANMRSNERSNNENREKNVQSENRPNSNQAEVTSSRRGGRAQSMGFSDINVSSQTRRYIHIISLILIFGSYLYLRLRKAKKDRAKRKTKLKREYSIQ